MTSEAKKAKAQERQRVLLAGFVGDFYQEKQVGDEWHVKQWNGTTNKWQVAVFTLQSFRRYKAFSENRSPSMPEDAAVRELKQAEFDNFRGILDGKLQSLGLHQKECRP